ncbi:MAG: phage late control D family protein, partial [Spirochaetaceae bacterium]|nr:phage late control D family protein [Spirochaetaceae bacterium]
MAGETAVLEVKFAGNGLTGLYPWDLVLEEGFSRLYRAELTALSSQKHTAEELAAAVDNGISVIIREKLVTSAVYRVRYLHGIVTAAINKGVFCSASKSDCYTYVFVIEPELARLKYTRHTAPFYKMRPAAITEKILSDYKIDVQVKDDYISRGKFGKNLMFNQFNISDLDFIDGITRLYGISYVFT